MAAAHTPAPDPTISDNQEPYQAPQADLEEEFSALCTILPSDDPNESSTQRRREARIQRIGVAWAVAEGAPAPDAVISDHYEAFPYKPAARTSPAESKVPQAFRLIGDSQEQLETIGESRYKVAATPEDFPKALALSGNAYRSHSKANQCALDQKSPTLTVHRQLYHTIVAPRQYTPALSFLGSRAPLSIYRGRSRFSTTPDDQDKPESVAQRCTHLQRADKVGAVLPRSDSDCKVRRQAQDSSEVVLATGEVQHYSQQYKQAAAYATLAHILEAGGQEDRHRVDLPTRLQVLQRH